MKAIYSTYAIFFNLYCKLKNECASKSSLMISQKVIPPVIASVAKQSPDFKLLQRMRLLRYARNDIRRDFLQPRQH